MTKRHIVAVDDDQSFLKVLSFQLRGMGFKVSSFISPTEALEAFSSGSRADAVITDLRMPEMNGIEFLDKILQSDKSLPVIVLTAHGSIETAVEATKTGAFDFLTKPFEREELEQTIRNALKMSDLTRENQRLSKAVSERFRFEGIIGTSERFRRALKMAEQLSEVDSTVLIEGESGTGKELVARAIHFNGPRKYQPFVVVNCGAIPEDLMESELFGYKKGAFTGATADKKGKFEIADSGTIFLDEIGDLSLNMQVKLLRVLQHRTIDIVGDPTPRTVDVRIIAASNRNLLEMVEAKEFREDLYYRLSVAPVQLPSLRERREDIPLLTRHFIEKLEKKFDRKIELAPGVLESLQSHNWPGNVRELENVIERLLVFSTRDRITKHDLPPHVRRHSIQSLGEVVVHLPEKGFSLEELERDILQTALEMHQWNQTRAAQYLQITRNTLIYRMQKFGLKEEDVSK